MRWLMLGIFAGLVSYIVGMAAVGASTSRYQFHELLLPRSIDCLVFAWLFWIGSAIGSFLNVVAWRMPRGRSINGLSHCPWCDHRLAARDNWPVFGWFMLRGRCRTCRLPISPRYPIVEAAVGLSLALVGFMEIQGALENIPYTKHALGFRGPMGMPVITQATVGMWAYHTIALAGVWALGLVRFDDQRLPARLVVWVIGSASFPALLWWWLGVTPWQASLPGDWPQWTFPDVLLRQITAIAAAVFAGRVLARYLCPTADPKLDPTGQGTARLIDLIVMLSVPALLVGWQALIAVVVVASLVAILLRNRWRLDRDGLAWFSVALPVALTIQLAGWKWWESSGWWPSAQASPAVVLLAAAVMFIAPAWLKTRVETPDTVLAEECPSEESD